jgi:NAD(P)-dependent dehydrogenase (short-subunit alcohol dehydrogenase family)
MSDLKSIFSLEGKIVIVTGAMGLLGRKHAESIAVFGGTPILIDINAEKIEDFSNELNDLYDVNSVGYEVDITSEYQIEKNVNQIINKFGKIDCLVNNAANNPKIEESNDKNFSRLENFPMDIWMKDLAVGLTGSFLCAKHYGSSIAKNKHGGVIVNISSDLGIIAPDQRLYQLNCVDENKQSVKPVTYSVVKTGIIGLTRYLATYWNDRNVRCNVMCPGGVENGQSLDFLSSVSQRIPMGRLANKDEYQGTLIWMLSDSSSYLNGAIIPIDGGRTCW